MVIHVVRRAHGVGAATRRHDEAGLTLLEVLVAIVLLGIAFAGIAAGLLTTMSASAGNNGRVTADTALVEVTERLTTSPYVSLAVLCPLAVSGDNCVKNMLVGWPAVQADGSYRLGGIASGATYKVAFTSVQYWDMTNRRFTATKPATDTGSQLISVKVTAAGSSAPGSVVVRNPVAPVVP